MVLQSMLESISDLPSEPGVYFFFDQKERLLYIGKSVNIRKRVTNHFRKMNQKHFIERESEFGLPDATWINSVRLSKRSARKLTRLLLDKQRKKKEKIQKNTKNIRYVVTASEEEALTLEGFLISAFRPKYNRAVARFPFVEITLGEKIPRVLTCYQTLAPESFIYGPFTTGKLVDTAMEAFLTVIPVCNSLVPVDLDSKRTKPCLRYFMHRCNAPCREPKLLENYREQVDRFIAELHNQGRGIVKILRKNMQREVDCRNFEGAQIFKERIAAIEQTFASQCMPTILTKYEQELDKVIKQKHNYRAIIAKIIDTNGWNERRLR
jgi:excinuclease ABC subunit C